MKQFSITFVLAIVRTTLRTTVLAIFLLASQLALADRGRPAEEASSRVTISLAILPSITIDTIADVHFDIDRRDIDANYEEFFCVRGNASTRYSITAYGSSDSQNNFSLSNSVGDTLRYEVSYKGQTESTQYDLLSPGKPSPVYAVISGDNSCDGQPNFNIRFLANDLEAAESGLYSGALTLVVAPV